MSIETDADPETGASTPPGTGDDSASTGQGKPPSDSGKAPRSSTALPGATESRSMEKMGIPQSAVNQLKNGEPVAGVKGLLRGQWDAGQHYANKFGEKAAKAVPGKGIPSTMAKTGLKAGAKFLPGVGAAIAGVNAYDDFTHGDYVGGIFNVIGMIPGPVGWAGIGASMAWDFFHDGHDGYGMWDAPDGSSTQMLPGAASDVTNVAEVDSALTDAQRAVFAYPDGPQGTVWNQHPPSPLRLDTPEVEAKVKAWLTGISDQFAQIDQTMQASGEPYLLKYRAKLAPHFAAMEKLPSRAKEIVAQLAATSDGAGDAYKAVIDANHAARTQLASDGSLTDHGPAAAMKTRLERAHHHMGSANEKLANLFADSPPPVLTSDIGSSGGHNKPVHKPKPTTPAATTPHTPAATKPATPPMPKMPTAPPSPLGRGGGLGGGSPLGGGMPHGGGGGGTPLAPHTAKPAGSEHRLDDGHERKDDKADDKKKPVLSGSRTDNAKTGATAGEKPHGAKPLAPAAKPGVSKLGEKKPEPSREVDVKGHKTTFPDAKTAKMAQLLAGADPNHPLSLADAAAQAGLAPPVPGQDPGQQIAPADAKAGDLLVSGDKHFLMLGDGQFYDLDAYKVVGADALPADMGDRAGYFHLPDAGAGAQPPVSGQTPGGVPFDVPGGTPPPSEPADASAPVTSAGTPGVPAPGRGGPTNAAATDTGTGDSVPSSAPHNLDPGAVK